MTRGMISQVLAAAGREAEAAAEAQGHGDGGEHAVQGSDGSGSAAFDGQVHAVQVIQIVQHQQLHFRDGSLAPGKDADIVVWDGNPQENKSSVRAAFINGQQVWPK